MCYFIYWRKSKTLLTTTNTIYKRVKSNEVLLYIKKIISPHVEQKVG